MSKEKEINNSKKFSENLANSSSTEPKETKQKVKEKITEPKSEKDKQIESLKEKNAGLEAEVRDLKEKNLRLLADLSNQSKIHAKEISEIIKYGNERLLKRLLFFPDSYERALQFSQNDPDPKIQSFLTGFQMVLTEFQDFLKREGVEEIKITPLKDVYNYELHKETLEVREKENDKYPAGTILQVLQKGYLIHQPDNLPTPATKLNSRVLRPALVEISKIKDIESKKKK